MISLTMLLKKEKIGYLFGKDKKVTNHLLFMDNLTFFSRDAIELDQLVEMVVILEWNLAWRSVQ